MILLANRFSFITTFVVALVVAQLSLAQSTWTGLASPDNHWANAGNWDLGVPGSGDTAEFVGPGNGNTTISLGGTTQPINTIAFTGGLTTVAYTIGQAPGDALLFDGGGLLTAGLTPGTDITTGQTFNAAVNTNGSLTVQNYVSNGGNTAGNGVAGLTFSNINIGGGGTLLINAGNGSLGATTTVLNGNITESAGQPASLHLLGSTTGTSNNTNFIIKGTNTYTGDTTIEVNTGSNGSIQIGSDSPFGTGKIISNLVANSAQYSAIGGAHTVPNRIDMNGGITFVGTNPLSFTGPITEITTANRTISNISSSMLTFGSSPGSSTITLGNPMSNGGDDLGRNLIFNAGASATSVINDILQDPAPGGGTASGTVTYQGATGGIFTIQGQNTYTGTTTIGAGTVHIQFNHDYAVGGTSGPFGTGTIITNTTSPQPILEPFGGDRTLDNKFDMNFGFTIGNVGTDTSGLTLTNTLTLRGNGRTITNNLSYDPTTDIGGTFTLGSAGSPSTFTLSTGTNQTTILTGSGKYVINDTIVDGGTGGQLSYNNAAAKNAPVTINSQSTYTAQTNLSGNAQLFRIASSSDGLPGPSFTKGPFGKGTINFNNQSNQHLRPTGGNRLISNAITMTSGFAMDNAPGETFSMTMAGPITMANSRTITNGFVTGSSGGTFIIGDPSAPKTITLPASANGSLSIAALTGPIVVNDVIQNASGFVGTVILNSKSQTPEGGDNQADNNSITINGQNTYTGTTTFGFATVASTGPIQIGVSSVGNPGSVTSGPFGTGTLTFVNTTTGTPPLVPFGADRTVANAISINGNMAAANAGAQTFNLNLNGPISLTTLTPTDVATRTLTNNMAGTLTLGGTGSPAPSTITLGSTAAEALTFQTTNANATTVVNDTIQDASGGGAGTLNVASGTVQLNANNSYTGGTNVSGGTLLVNNTTGSGTGAGAVTLTGGVLGGTGTVSGAVNNGGAIAPGNPAGAPATLTASNNVTDVAGAAWNIGLSGASADKLAVGGNLDLNALDTLNISGTGTGSSWVIASYTGTLIGTFDSVTAGYNVDYGTGTNSQITLHAAAVTGVPGDYNGNGVVDMADYVLWRKGGPLQNEVNTPGTVDASDYTAWRARFGNTSGSGSAKLGDGSAVPEPATLMLLITSIAGFATARFSRRVAA